MKADITFALDVGGTFIKACVVENEHILKDTICQFSSNANESKETIINHLSNIILFLCRQYEKYKGQDSFGEKALGIGFAFPGPFDYGQGISYIRGLDKFESLYGVCLYSELMQAIKTIEFVQKCKEVDIRFENDGRLFGLGASTLYPKERLICLTIGTGLGSVFIDQGRMVKNDGAVPEEGYLYNQLYKGQIVDDHFSRRGILKKASIKGIHGSDIDVKDIADMARAKDLEAKRLFEEFGSDLAEMLLPFIHRFQPQHIIIGGQIAKSLDLFEDSMKEHLDGTSLSITALDNALHYTFVGIDHLFSLK